MSLKKFIEINLKLRVELIALISSGNQNIAYLINWLKKLLIPSSNMIYSDIIHFIFKNTPKKLKIITIFVTKMEYNFCLQYNDKIADLKNPAKNVGLKTLFSPIKCKIFDTKITIYQYRPKKKIVMNLS